MERITQPESRSELAEVRRVAARAPMLDASTETDYLRRIRHDGDPQALSALMASHLRLVLSIARRFARRGVAVEDLVAEGNLGLLEAAHRFDPERGTRFAAYAAWWVRALIRRHALGNRRIVAAPSTRSGRRLVSTLGPTRRRLQREEGSPPSRERLAQVLDVSVADVAMVESALGARDVAVGENEAGALDVACPTPSPEALAATAEEARLVSRSIEQTLTRLSSRERTIVERRFLADERESLSSIGEDLGLSRERVRQLESHARNKLRAVLRTALRRADAQVA